MHKATTHSKHAHYFSYWHNASTTLNVLSHLLLILFLIEVHIYDLGFYCGFKWQAPGVEITHIQNISFSWAEKNSRLKLLNGSFSFTSLSTNEDILYQVEVFKMSKSRKTWFLWTVRTDNRLLGKQTLNKTSLGQINWMMLRWFY